jgi:phosphoglycolate phosphatase-like HAD superfamily hydrolase
MRAVFLDLDGTLTDSGEGILKSVDYALGKLDLPALSGDTDWIIGPPLWDSFTRLHSTVNAIPRSDILKTSSMMVFCNSCPTCMRRGI